MTPSYPSRRAHWGTRHGDWIPDTQPFKEVNERYGKTEVIVTHDTRVGRIADRCLRIEDGKIVREETLDIYAFREKEKFEAQDRKLPQRLQRLTELVGQMSEELQRR